MASSGTGVSQLPASQEANQTTIAPGTNAGNQAAPAATPGGSSQNQQPPASTAGATSAANEAQQPIPADNQFPQWAIPLFGLYLIVACLAALYLLLKLWPDDASATGAAAIWLWGKRFFVLPETRNLWLAISAGALGSYIHLATSFVDFAGNRRLAKSWIWWYLLRPFIGASLALLVYVGIRAGLITASTSASTALSPYGIAAIAGLTGMFSKQATDKLREVFENFFKAAPAARADALQEQKPATADAQKATAAGAGK